MNNNSMGGGSAFGNTGSGASGRGRGRGGGRGNSAFGGQAGSGFRGTSRGRGSRGSTRGRGSSSTSRGRGGGAAGGSASDPNNKALYIKNVPAEVNNRNALAEAFSQFGVVENVKCNTTKCYATVFFAEKQAAVMAKKTVKTLGANNSPVQLFWSSLPSASSNPQSNNPFQQGSVSRAANQQNPFGAGANTAQNAQSSAYAFGAQGGNNSGFGGGGISNTGAASGFSTDAVPGNSTGFGGSGGSSAFGGGATGGRSAAFGGGNSGGSSAFGGRATGNSSAFGGGTTGNSSAFGGGTTGNSSAFGGGTTGNSSAFGGGTKGNSSAFGGGTTGNSSAFGGGTTGNSSAFGGGTTGNSSAFGGGTTGNSSAFGGGTKGNSSAFGGGTKGNSSAFGGGTTGNSSAFGGGATGNSSAFGGGATGNSSAFGGGTTGNSSAFGGGTTGNSSAFGGGAKGNSSAFGGGTKGDSSAFGWGAAGSSSAFGSGATANSSAFGGGTTGKSFEFGGGATGKSSPFGGGASGKSSVFGGGTAGKSSVFGSGATGKSSALGDGEKGGSSSAFGGGALTASSAFGASGKSSGFGGSSAFGATQKSSGFGEPDCTSASGSSGELIDGASTFGTSSKTSGFGASADSSFGGGAAKPTSFGAMGQKSAFGAGKTDQSSTGANSLGADSGEQRSFSFGDFSVGGPEPDKGKIGNSGGRSAFGEKSHLSNSSAVAFGGATGAAFGGGVKSSLGFGAKRGNSSFGEGGAQSSFGEGSQQSAFGGAKVAPKKKNKQQEQRGSGSVFGQSGDSANNFQTPRKKGLASRLGKKVEGLVTPSPALGDQNNENEPQAYDETSVYQSSAGDEYENDGQYEGGSGQEGWVSGEGITDSKESWPVPSPQNRGGKNSVLSRLGKQAEDNEKRNNAESDAESEQSGASKIAALKSRLMKNKPSPKKTDKTLKVSSLMDTPQFRAPSPKMAQIANEGDEVTSETRSMRFDVSGQSSERYRILDDRDKAFRESSQGEHTSRRDLKDAVSMIGTCEDMCPEKERYQREVQNDLSAFEIIKGTEYSRTGQFPHCDHTKAIKKYRRPAAGNEHPLPHEVRSPKALLNTFDYIICEILNQPVEGWTEVYHFVRDRTRSIRQDLTFQNLRGRESIDVTLKSCRFHIHAAHQLCEEPPSNFEPKMNDEQMKKCLQSLSEFYDDLRYQEGVTLESENEVRCYYILLNMLDNDILRRALSFEPSVRNSAEVKFALEVVAAATSNNYVRFFRLAKRAPYLSACLIHRFFGMMRQKALQVMNRAYKKSKVHMRVLVELLGYDSEEEADRACQLYGLKRLGDRIVQFGMNSFVIPEAKVRPLKSNKLVGCKLTSSVGVVVNGNQKLDGYLCQLTSSFDENGNLLELGNEAVESVQVDFTGRKVAKVDSRRVSYSTIAGGATKSTSVPAVGHTPAFDHGNVDSSSETAANVVGHTGAGKTQAQDEEGVAGIKKKNSTSESKKVETERAIALYESLLSEVLDPLVEECYSKEAEKVAAANREKEMLKAKEKERNLAAVKALHENIALEVADSLLQDESIEAANNVATNVKLELEENSDRQRIEKIAAEQSVDIESIVVHDVLETLVKEELLEMKRQAAIVKLSEKVQRNRLRSFFSEWWMSYLSVSEIRRFMGTFPYVVSMMSPEEQLALLLGRNRQGFPKYKKAAGLGSPFRTFKRPNYVTSVEKIGVEEDGSSWSAVDFMEIFCPDNGRIGTYVSGFKNAIVFKLVVVIPTIEREEVTSNLSYCLGLAWLRSKLSRSVNMEEKSCDGLELLSLYSVELNGGKMLYNDTKLFMCVKMVKNSCPAFEDEIRNSNAVIVVAEPASTVTSIGMNAYALAQLERVYHAGCVLETGEGENNDIHSLRAISLFLFDVEDELFETIANESRTFRQQEGNVLPQIYRFSFHQGGKLAKCSQTLYECLVFSSLHRKLPPPMSVVSVRECVEQLLNTYIFPALKNVDSLLSYLNTISPDSFARDQELFKAISRIPQSIVHFFNACMHFTDMLLKGSLELLKSSIPSEFHSHSGLVRAHCFDEAIAAIGDCRLPDWNTIVSPSDSDGACSLAAYHTCVENYARGVIRANKGKYCTTELGMQLDSIFSMSSRKGMPLIRCDLIMSEIIWFYLNIHEFDECMEQPLRLSRDIASCFETDADIIAAADRFGLCCDEIEKGVARAKKECEEIAAKKKRKTSNTMDYEDVSGIDSSFSIPLKDEPKRSKQANSRGFGSVGEDSEFDRIERALALERIENDNFEDFLLFASENRTNTSANAKQVETEAIVSNGSQVRIDSSSASPLPPRYRGRDQQQTEARRGTIIGPSSGIIGKAFMAGEEERELYSSKIDRLENSIKDIRKEDEVYLQHLANLMEGH
eukprot:Nk52_evm10s227 gene=Nk52_evmTU10s227